MFFLTCQVPSLPAKRKAPENPLDAYKTSKQPRVEDVPELPAAQPDIEMEEDEDDEEGGRFHGSGMSSEQRAILEYFDKEDASGEGEVIGREGFTERDVKRLASGLEKAIETNEARRAKFPNDPTKYIDSEADLFAAVASFTVLSEHPELYPALVSTGAFERLVGLFAHENIDIAISVLEVLVELTGEDVELKQESDMQVLIDSLFKNDAIEVMIGNLERLDESKDDDQRAVFHTLSTGLLCR